jgi:hypothetical protein
MADKTIRVRYNGTITAYNETYEYNHKQYTGACFKVVLDQLVL